MDYSRGKSGTFFTPDFLKFYESTMGVDRSITGVQREYEVLNFRFSPLGTTRLQLLSAVS